MAYIYRMNELDIELASEFVVMAAQLIEIKSKMMLPAEETEEEEWVDPREELMKRLLEYKVFKQISGYLKDHEQSYAETVTKDPEYYPDLQSDYSAVEIDGSVLEEALRRLLAEYEIKQEQEASNIITMSQKTFR
jgi:segregation and condensation protein A